VCLHLRSISLTLQQQQQQLIVQPKVEVAAVPISNTKQFLEERHLQPIVHSSLLILQQTHSRTYSFEGTKSDCTLKGISKDSLGFL